MTKGFVGLVGIAASAFMLLFAPGASGATVVGDYQLQGNLASSGAGPVLTEVGSGGPTSFQSETVMGTNRQVLAFPQDTGLSMLPSVGTGDVPYSVVTTFRFQTLDLYRRILDPLQGGSDSGFYEFNGAADIFGVGEAMGPTAFTPNTYATVALTSLPSAGSRFYVNGAAPPVELNETFPVVADNLRFFLDNGSENSAGAVSCIRVFTGVLTDAEVAAIGSSPTCQAPAPPPAKKKCKKHKKKHRSAESAKKKCKKHKKR